VGSGAGVAVAGGGVLVRLAMIRGVFVADGVLLAVAVAVALLVAVGVGIAATMP
jgi:hypothetical protein